MVSAQGPGNVISTALAKEKAYSLDNGHHGEDNAHGTCCAVAFQHTYKIGIRHIIKRGDEHADDTGNCQLTNELSYRSLCHFAKFCFLFCFKTVHTISFPPESAWFL